MLLIEDTLPIPFRKAENCNNLVQIVDQTITLRIIIIPNTASFFDHFPQFGIKHDIIIRLGIGLNTLQWFDLKSRLVYSHHQSKWVQKRFLLLLGWRPFRCIEGVEFNSNTLCVDRSLVIVDGLDFGLTTLQKITEIAR